MIIEPNLNQKKNFKIKSNVITSMFSKMSNTNVDESGKKGYFLGIGHLRALCSGT